MLNRAHNYKQIQSPQNLLCQNIPESQNLLYLGLRIIYFPQGLVEVAEQVETSIKITPYWD